MAKKNFWQKNAVCFFIAAAAVLTLIVPAHAFREKPADRIEYTCGEANSGKRLLVAYDTEHGATATIADKIAQVLCEPEQGFQVDLKLARKVTDISSYDGVIIGTPIYTGSWLPGVNRMLRWHEKAIAAKPHALFVNCTYLKEDTQEIRAKVMDMWVSPVLAKYPSLAPASIGLLAGEFSFKELFPLEFLLMKLMKYQDGDYRDFDKAASWAVSLKDVFN